MQMYIAVGLDTMESEMFGIRNSLALDSPLLQSALLIFAKDEADARGQAEVRLGPSQTPPLIREIGQFHSIFGGEKFFHDQSNIKPIAFGIRNHNDTNEGVLLRLDMLGPFDATSSSNWYDALFTEAA